MAASNVIKHEGQRADLSKRTTSHLNVKTDIREEVDNRVFKKRRTSSDGPDEAKLFEQEDHAACLTASPDAAIDSEPEADPNGDEWDDLDAEDGDDPLMVSEYVHVWVHALMPIECSLIPFSKTENLARYSSYPESALLPTANLMLNNTIKLVRHVSFHRKYFLKVSMLDFTRYLTYIVCR